MKLCEFNSERWWSCYKLELRGVESWVFDNTCGGLDLKVLDLGDIALVLKRARSSDYRVDLGIQFDELVCNRLGCLGSCPVCINVVSKCLSYRRHDDWLGVARMPHHFDVKVVGPGWIDSVVAQNCKVFGLIRWSSSHCDCCCSEGQVRISEGNVVKGRNSDCRVSNNVSRAFVRIAGDCARRWRVDKTKDVIVGDLKCLCDRVISVYIIQLRIPLSVLSWVPLQLVEANIVTCKCGHCGEWLRC